MNKESQWLIFPCDKVWNRDDHGIMGPISLILQTQIFDESRSNKKVDMFRTNIFRPKPALLELDNKFMTNVRRINLYGPI